MSGAVTDDNSLYTTSIEEVSITDSPAVCHMHGDFKFLEGVAYFFHEAGLASGGVVSMGHVVRKIYFRFGIFFFEFFDFFFKECEDFSTVTAAIDTDFAFSANNELAFKFGFVRNDVSRKPSLDSANV